MIVGFIGILVNATFPGTPGGYYCPYSQRKQHFWERIMLVGYYSTQVITIAYGIKLIINN
jgi:hypothetical protein